MYWKFFELVKFAKHQDSKEITKNSPLKVQWLDFLLHCSQQRDIPENRDEAIKVGYEIMDQLKWEPDERTLHWKHVQNEQEGIRLLEQEKAKGKIEGEIKMIKNMLKSRMDPDQISAATKTSPQLAKFIQDHPNIDASELLSSHSHLLGDVQDDVIDHPG